VKIATCQFPVSNSISRNAATIRKLMRQARQSHADLAHFPECALTGYAGVDRESPDDIDWDELQEQTEEIMRLAAALRLWVVLGSTHRLTSPHKPHNCLYLIDTQGQLVDRYDKRFCTESDLKHYCPGDHFVTFDINGVRCSLLICFDLRLPELYRQLLRRRVQCVIQSFYNARQQGPSVHTHIMRQTMQANAANNGFWVSMANASGYYAPYSSCFIQPDGLIVSQIPRHRTGLIVNTVDTSQTFYDPMARFRHGILAGKLSNGPTPNDPRSQQRKTL